MRRRDLIAILGGAAAWPLATHAQQSAMPVIGFVSGGFPTDYARFLTSFRQGLRDAGFVEGENVAIEQRWAEGRYERLPAFAAEFVKRPVTVIAAASLPAALAAKAATPQLPIVFTSGGDPVADGLVASLNRPGANLTGVSAFFGEMGAKRLELLREFIPANSTIAVLINPGNPNARTRLAEVVAGAQAVAQPIQVFNARNASEIDTAFAEVVRQRLGGLLVADDPLFISQRDQLVSLSARHKLPAIYIIREFATAGGLIAYGVNFADIYRKFGDYVARVLRGTKPADLPVMQPTKFELVINLKTAKALGLDLPATLLARADEVIE
jgi:putative tryptophan/tyrosine transport system substrate-binding protein